MPIYEFACHSCGKVFERIVFGSDDDEPHACPSCGCKETGRVMSSFSRGYSAGSEGSASTSCAPTGGFS